MELAPFLLVGSRFAMNLQCLLLNIIWLIFKNKKAVMAIFLIFLHYSLLCINILSTVLKFSGEVNFNKRGCFRKCFWRVLASTYVYRLRKLNLLLPLCSKYCSIYIDIPHFQHSFMSISLR